VREGKRRPIPGKTEKKETVKSTKNASKPVGEIGNWPGLHRKRNIRRWMSEWTKKGRKVRKNKNYKKGCSGTAPK